MAKKAKRGYITYRSYVFREKDPVIDALRTAVSDAHVKYETLADESGVSANTIKSWFHGGTKRPQFATTTAVALALGKRGIMFNRNGCKLVD